MANKLWVSSLRFDSMDRWTVVASLNGRDVAAARHEVGAAPWEKMVNRLVVVHNREVEAYEEKVAALRKALLAEKRARREFNDDRKPSAG